MFPRVPFAFTTYPTHLTFLLSRILSCFPHRRSQDFCLEGGTRPTPPSLASVVHTFEAVAGSWRSVSTPAVSRELYESSPRAEQIAKNSLNDIWGRVFVNVVSLKYIGMIYINVGEMCFIPMNIHIEQFNGVRRLRWQHLSPVVSTCLHLTCFYPPFHKTSAVHILPPFFCGTPSRFPN